MVLKRSATKKEDTLNRQKKNLGGIVEFLAKFPDKVWGRPHNTRGGLPLCYEAF
jgi:hypothetical protein